jgi:hypothetical protein
VTGSFLFPSGCPRRGRPYPAGYRHARCRLAPPSAGMVKLNPTQWRLPCEAVKGLKVIKLLGYDASEHHQVAASSCFGVTDGRGLPPSEAPAPTRHWVRRRRRSWICRLRVSGPWPHMICWTSLNWTWRRRRSRRPGCRTVRASGTAMLHRHYARLTAAVADATRGDAACARK